MTDFTSPVGRLVGGSLTSFETTDREGKPLIWAKGPNAGQPRVAYWFQLAIAKNNPEWPAFDAIIRATARAAFAHVFDAAGNCTFRDFGWKVEDGDSTEVKTAGGKSPSQREGCPGHWIVRFSGSYAPKCVNTARPPAEVPSNTIKLGDFVRVGGSVVGNGDAKEPGLYINYTFTQFIGYGAEIQFGPDAAAVFATPVGYTPPGMSATPVGPAASLTPPAQAEAAAYTTPHPGPLVPPPPATIAPPPAPQVLAGPPLYIVAGNKYTAEQLAASGYTPELLATLPRA